MNKHPIRYPSQDTLHEWLAYHETTGIFRWKKKPTKRKTPLAGDVAGYPGPNGYWRVHMSGYGDLPAHRLAWIYVHGDIPKGHDIDHKDGVRSNNVLTNLRVATRAQNLMNMRTKSNNKSGLKGAWLHSKTGRWTSQIRVGGKCFYLGLFDTAEEANAAYKAAAQKHNGEFARF